MQDEQPVTSFQQLYDRVCTLNAVAPRPPDTFRDQVVLAHGALLDRLATEAPGKIREAAEAGYQCATLCEWKHEDTFEGVDLLHLIRGAKTTQPFRPSVRRGMPGPILFILRDHLAPFRVIHEWDRAAQVNRLLARWP